MALELSSSTLSTDKKYFFLENSEVETDGYNSLDNLFMSLTMSGDLFELGKDKDARFALVPPQLLTFNNTTETEE